MKTFKHLFEQQLGYYLINRASVYDSRARRRPQLFNSDVTSLVSLFNKVFSLTQVKPSSNYWDKISLRVKSSTLGQSFLLYTDYLQFWEELEAICKALDDQGIHPKTGTFDVKFYILTAAAILAALMFSKRR